MTYGEDEVDEPEDEDWELSDEELDEDEPDAKWDIIETTKGCFVR